MSSQVSAWVHLVAHAGPGLPSAQPLLCYDSVSLGQLLLLEIRWCPFCQYCSTAVQLPSLVRQSLPNPILFLWLVPDWEEKAWRWSPISMRFYLRRCWSRSSTSCLPVTWKVQFWFANIGPGLGRHQRSGPGLFPGSMRFTSFPLKFFVMNIPNNFIWMWRRTSWQKQSCWLCQGWELFKNLRFQLLIFSSYSRISLLGQIHEMD